MRAKLILFFPFLFFFLSLSAQETKKIKRKLSDGSKEEFYVLKTCDTIKQGAYIHKSDSGDLLEQGNFTNGKRNGLWENFNWGGELAEKGYYKNDLKDSLWEIYHHGIVQASGNYTNGEKSGNWTFTSSEGKKEQVYDYTQKKMIWYDTSSFTERERTFKILIGTDSEKVVLDSPPLYIGGSEAMFSVLLNNVRYPFAEREKGTQGTVYISYDINTDGIAENFKVYKSVSPGLDKEAMRVLMLMKNNWTPAMYKNNPVRVTIVMPVKFRLQ